MLKDKGWNNHSCIKFLLSQKSEVSKIVVLENPAWALASGHVLSLKGNATDFGFLKLLLLLLQALPENRFRGDVLFLCHPPGVLHISATSICFEGILLLCALRVCTILPGHPVDKVLPLVGFHWLLQFWPILNKCLHCPQNALAIKIEAQNPVPFTFTHCTVNTG